jgi:hypothetical protein
MRTRTTRIGNGAIAIAAFLFLSASATAQTRSTGAATVQLGNQVITIPSPDGFEEAASQFERVKNQFTLTEAPENDMLAVHMPRAVCDRLRAGEFGPFNFYTKISVRQGIRDLDYSAERFANLVSEFRKSSSRVLDVNSPAMKATLEHIGQGLSEINKQETEFNMTQPINLGEFDTRPNVYSVMLLLNIKTVNSGNETSALIAGGLSYVRVKQRLIYVYTYRRYESKADVETLRDFTKQWIGQILAAN